jgi:predicted amidophosphoribosyltransferase
MINPMAPAVCVNCSQPLAGQFCVVCEEKAPEEKDGCLSYFLADFQGRFIGPESRWQRNIIQRERQHHGEGGRALWLRIGPI